MGYTKCRFGLHEYRPYIQFYRLGTRLLKCETCGKTKEVRA